MKEDSVMEIMFASQNQGKIDEYKTLLSPAKIIPVGVEVEETGLTFHENALLKARACASEDMGLYIGDDSGLMIDALGNMPGIHTKRWKGAKNANESLQNVLSDLQKWGEEGQPNTAMMVSVIALITHKSDPLPMFFIGMVDGDVLIEPKGKAKEGFCYDSHFYIPSEGKTFAEMGDRKNEISHRRKAVSKLREFILDLL